MDLIEGSETSAIINETPGNYPKESLLYSVHGESLKSRKLTIYHTIIQKASTSVMYYQLHHKSEIYNVSNLETVAI